MNEYIKLAEEIHKTAIDKGWWNTERNKDELFMLIITELAEAVESDRKDIWVSTDNLEKYKESSKSKVHFEKLIKDTVEDELADVVIRCLDYLFFRAREHMIIPHINFKFTENFAENVFMIAGLATDRQIMEVFVATIQFAERQGVDIMWHVKEKMQYNGMRSQKHGGKKY